LYTHEQPPRPSKYHGESYPRQSGHCRAPPHGRGIRLGVGCDRDNGPLSFGGLPVVESCRSVLLLCWHHFHWDSYRKQSRGARTFHYIALVILTVSSITYFSMASDLGQTSVRTEFRSDEGITRSIFVCFFPSYFHCSIPNRLQRSGCDTYNGLSTRHSSSSWYC
jgi:hypothetical protein